MSILIIGNVTKDVYLSLDERSESLEQDRDQIAWLDLAFNGKSHRYYNRVSTFGGAGVALEVMAKFGFAATISGSRLDYTADPDPDYSYPAGTYNYILTLEDSACFFTSDNSPISDFTTPSTPPDYLYIDHSARLTPHLESQIVAYLDAHPETSLVLCADNSSEQNTLARLADFILDSTDFHNPRPKFTTDTALSLYHATYFCAKISGFSEADSLALARANLEHSKLDSTLDRATLLSFLKKTTHSKHDDLILITAALMENGKGILAADESGGSIKKKFAALGIPDDYAHRHAYRDIFFTTPDIEDYLSGIILFDETARDHMSDLAAIPDYLIAKRIIPGIKVDQGLTPFGENETITKGLDGLASRLTEYYNMGLRFAKWRAAFNITKDSSGHILTPTDAAIKENCRILAEYAAACVRAGLVPIMEPEVVYDGDYTITDSYDVTARVLDCLNLALADLAIDPRTTIYKINMVSSGKKASHISTPAEVGETTSALLLKHVPASLGGLVFLSGGQTPEAATANLAAIISHGPYPFPVTFSFARALQDPALYAWQGNDYNLQKARQAFLGRLIANRKALG